MKRKALVIAAVMAAVISSHAVLPVSVEAGWGDVIKSAVVAGVQSKAVIKSLDAYDNEKRGELFEHYKETYGVSDDYNANVMMDRVMKNLIRAIGTTDNYVYEKPYYYFVNQEKSFNAFCSLGHIVSANIGTFSFTGYNEDKVAAVIAHEMVHGQKNHALKNAKKKLTVGSIASVIASGTGAGGDIAVSVIAKNINNVHITKPNEREADNISFDYMAAAGYNVGACAALWQQVLEGREEQKNVLADILNPSDHPEPKERRDNFAKKMFTYSGDVVSVESKTGSVKIRNKDFVIPANAFGLSSMQRAYLVAGNLAKAYHNGAGKEAAYVENGVVMLGGYGIITAAGGAENAYDLAAKLNSMRGM